MNKRHWLQRMTLSMMTSSSLVFSEELTKVSWNVCFHTYEPLIKLSISLWANSVKNKQQGE